MVKPVVTFKDFDRIDLRAGTVRDVQDLDGSSKLYRLTVDLGQEYGTRTIMAGVKPWYTKEEISGKQFIFVANLEPRSMMGEESQGMIIAVESDGKAVLLPVPDGVQDGAILR